MQLKEVDKLSAHLQPRNDYPANCQLPDDCSLLLVTQLEVLSSLNTQLLLRLALLTFQSQSDLLRRFRLYQTQTRVTTELKRAISVQHLLVKNRLGLTSETHLLGVVSPFSLSQYSRR